MASSISFISKGPTAGLLNVAEISEEKPDAAAVTEGEAEQNDENDEVTRWKTATWLLKIMKVACAWK